MPIQKQPVPINFAQALKMLPSFCLKNVAYMSSAYFKFFRKHFLGDNSSLIRTFYFFNVFVSKLSTTSEFAYIVSLSSFLGFIDHIIQWGTKKKMAWSYAFFIIAFVANIKSFWNGTIMNFKRQSMGIIMLIINIYSSISRHHYRARPNPTFFSFFNSIPKWDLSCIDYIHSGVKT